MKLKIKQWFLDKHNILFVLVLIIGAVVRLWQFGTLPCGLNQDEAFAGYQAFSLAEYGIDPFGYENPVYFTAWGSGMNALESYLAIPFIKLFGLSVYTIRLPQVICAIISLPVVYSLLKEVTGNRRLSLISMGLLAISPWHIMMSRWGLEANLAPAFLLFGIFFFVKGVRRNWYFILSALFYGLALYTYATTWILVPLVVLLSGIYLIFTKQKLMYRYIFSAAGVLFVLALPLLLFVLINNGFMDEIRTSFISIPKMQVIRNDELSIANLWTPSSYSNFFNLMVKQTDYTLWNSTEFGFFYLISIPFTVMGIVKLTINSFRSIRKREYDGYVLFWLALFCSVLTVLTLDYKNVNRSNVLFINLLICTAIGVEAVVEFFENKDFNLANYTLAALYAVYFLFFASYYFGDYNWQISPDFRGGVGEAVEFVNDKDFESVNVDSSIHYPQILFYDQTPTDEFIDTVEYHNYPARYLTTKSFTKYTFGIDYENVDTSYDCYIIRVDQQGTFVSMGYTVEIFDQFAVAYISE